MCQKCHDVKADVVFRGVSFTVAQALFQTEEGKVIIGEGISRRSFLDAPNPDLGDKIAIGRAQKSLFKKLNFEKNYSRFRG